MIFLVCHILSCGCRNNSQNKRLLCP